jgi:Ca2+:H+ antiporter
MGRTILWASLALTPATLLVHFAFGVGGTPSFVLAALALCPLAYLIGEATEHVAEHTGPGIGGFLNASFGNAPELIIALLAVADNLPVVVRGSITGSVVSNLLLVLGGSLALAPAGRVARRSLVLQIGTLAAALLLFLAPSVTRWNGGASRHTLYLITLPVAVVLLLVYVVVTIHNLRAHRAAHTEQASEDAWSLPVGIGVLAAATLATAFVSDVLVSTLDAFGHAIGLSQFFVAAVIVAIVGNAAEHGGALVTAKRGNKDLAAEIAVSSAAQVAVFVAPAIALLSFLVGQGLPLSFQWYELAALAGGVLLVAVTIADGCSRRWQGLLLIAAYLGIAIWYVLI